MCGLLYQLMKENVSDEENPLEFSDLGSTTSSSYDVPNMNYESSLTNTLHAYRTSPVSFAHVYHTKHTVSKYTEMVSVGSFDTTDDVQTLSNQLLDAELPAAPQLFQTLQKSLTYLRSKNIPRWI